MTTGMFKGGTWASQGYVSKFNIRDSLGEQELMSELGSLLVLTG